MTVFLRNSCTEVSFPRKLSHFQRFCTAHFLAPWVFFVCFVGWLVFLSQMRYLNYLSYKLADPEITLICRQNPICEVLPFPRCACHTWNKDLSPTEILLVAFPAEMSLYGSNCIKEAKSCVQPRVALGWGGMVELQQEQPGLGKDSVPELPGSAL